MEEAKPKLYSPLQAVISTVLIFFAGQFLGALLIGVALGAVYPNQDTAQLIESNTWLHFAYVATVEVITLYFIWLVLRRRKLSINALGINKLKLTHIGYTLAGFVAYFVFYLAALMLAKTLVPSLNLEQKQELGVDVAAQGRQLLPVFISLVILPPFVEEVVMRGFLFGGLRTRLRFASAAIITSVLFGFAHISQASDGLLWVAAIDTFVLSMVLCYLREKTDSLWPSIGVHAMKNGLAFVFLFNIFR